MLRWACLLMWASQLSGHSALADEGSPSFQSAAASQASAYGNARSAERERGGVSRPGPGPRLPVRLVEAKPSPAVSRPSDAIPVSGTSAADTASRNDEPLPLAAPSGTFEPGRSPREPRAAGHVVVTVLSSLAVVLGLFFLLVWFLRRVLPRASSSLPREVLEPLGRVPLNARQHMQLVRVGSKLLLLFVSPQGAETLTEITDPQEVERLVAICEQNQPGSISATFRQVLEQLGDEADSSPRRRGQPRRQRSGTPTGRGGAAEVERD